MNTGNGQTECLVYIQELLQGVVLETEMLSAAYCLQNTPKLQSATGTHEGLGTKLRWHKVRLHGGSRIDEGPLQTACQLAEEWREMRNNTEVPEI